MTRCVTEFDIEMDKLESLRKKLVEAKKANRADVQSEFVRKKTGRVNEKRLERLDKRMDDLELKKAPISCGFTTIIAMKILNVMYFSTCVFLQKQLAESTGQDIERLQAFDWTIEDVERWQKKQEEKAERADTGFTGLY